MPLIIGDAATVPEVISLARRVGVEVRHAKNAVGLAKVWRAAPLIMLTPDAVASVRRCRLPIRPAIILITAESDSQSAPCHLAERAGASYLAIWPIAEPWLADQLIRAPG